MDSPAFASFEVVLADRPVVAAFERIVPPVPADFAIIEPRI